MFSVFNFAILNFVSDIGCIVTVITTMVSLAAEGLKEKGENEKAKLSKNRFSNRKVHSYI